MVDRRWQAGGDQPSRGSAGRSRLPARCRPVRRAGSRRRPRRGADPLRAAAGSMRPNARSAPRCAMRVRKPWRNRFASCSAWPCSSGHSSGCRPGSASSQSQPAPGPQRAGSSWPARPPGPGRGAGPGGRGRGRTGPPAAGSVPMSCRRTSTPGRSAGSQDVSMSVASTRPALPTRAASQAGTVTPPAPTSQHRQPAVTPVSSRCRNVTGSSSRASASNRCRPRPAGCPAGSPRPHSPGHPARPTARPGRLFGHILGRRPHRPPPFPDRGWSDTPAPDT